MATQESLNPTNWQTVFRLINNEAQSTDKPREAGIKLATNPEISKHREALEIENLTLDQLNAIASLWVDVSKTNIKTIFELHREFLYGVDCLREAISY